MTLNTNSTDIQVGICSESDIVEARKMAREAAIKLGFGVTDVTRIVTAASELARNIFKYAGEGIVLSREVLNGGSVGIELIFVDSGPGIPDIDMALTPGYSTGGGLGMGLTGTKRLMDEMEIKSEVGKGTTVIIKKWLKR